MSSHPELEAEQAYLDRAYICLEEARHDAARLRTQVEVGPRGGTFQARYERDVIEEAVRTRLADLEVNDHALIFGRIDRDAGEGEIEPFHIGRLAIADREHEPVVIDWRAPVAEPFYRATGRNPMGLVRRRHFAVKGRRLTDLEDELFGEGHLGIGDERHDGLRGYGTLMAALEQARTGTLGDIVATIQREQDEIIRSPAAGVLVVQGGPGTGKTVVALHRAAYLLYTHRFPLEDQGVLVIGPNRLFLRYIERVLPSLGETGVEQVILADLVPDVRFGGTDTAPAARVKGDQRMAAVIAKAVHDRERPLRTEAKVPYGLSYLRLSVEESQRIVQSARRRFRRHNAARKWVEGEVFAALAATSRTGDSADTVRERTRHSDEVRELLERMWPVLTPAQLLADLFGSLALLRLAAGTRLSEAELVALHRPREAGARWSDADVALLDEARALLGPKPGRKADQDEIRTYGHLVIDEVQDLTPMQLRMAARRSLGGSMTVVGDLAQATGPFAYRSWDEVTAHLPDRRPARVVELSVGYRIPEAVMALATRVLRVAMPSLTPPRPVRVGDDPPAIVRVDTDPALAAQVVALVAAEEAAVGEGNVAVVAPASMVDGLAAAFEQAGLDYGMATRQGLDRAVTLVSIRLVKGLELDSVIVVEPGRIVNEENQGLRSLYVALTRATKRLTLVHRESLPEALI